MPLPDLLDGVPLAGLEEDAVAAAVDTVRRYCHWHIAPAYTQTFICAAPASGVIYLPSMRVTAVASVTVNGQAIPFDWDETGRVELQSRYPRGLRNVVIVATHGYDECPRDVRKVVADLAAAGGSEKRVRTDTIGPYSTTYFDDAGSTDDLDSYRLPVLA